MDTYKECFRHVAETGSLTLQPGNLLLLAMGAAALHWLFARSLTFYPLWSRAQGWVGELLECPACSGFWLGLALGWLGVRPVIGWPPAAEVAAAGVLAIFLTPTAEGLMLAGLKRSTIRHEAPEKHEEPPHPLPPQSQPPGA